jgi:predicted nucleic-acid-binding protein
VIAVDTSVVLRRLLADEASHTERANALFDSRETLLITDVVLAETVWTLKGKRYGATKEDISAAVMSLIEEPNVLFEDKQVVWSALNDFNSARPVRTSDGMKSADFADALVVNKARSIAKLIDQRYRATYTFDRAALELEGTASP